jgi:arabinogalactan endo-1,4-beta-galactosidase
METYKFSSDFAAGADVSWLPVMEATGFRFRGKDGADQDCLKTLKGFGLNAIRLRSWVNPSAHPHRGHCSTEETLAMALRAQAMGFDIMVDFHFGDSWCDPNQQRKPAAWEKLSFDELVSALYEYTRGAMETFASGGFTPKWVQLGNETNPGMLLPDGSIVNFPKLTRLYNAGHKAVKEISPSTKTIIHLAEGHSTEFIKSYFDALTAAGCTYDMAGLSYYPYWAKRPNSEILGDLAGTLKMIPERYDKDVIVVEIGGVDEEENESYDLLASVIETCAGLPRCKGLFYWEPQGAKAWSGYALSAWRADGAPTRAMDAYLLISR